MIIVDTCVLSEPLRPAPTPAVVDWIARHSPHLCTTSITLAELRYGVHRLADGRRKETLSRRLDGLLTGGFMVVHPFDADAALRYAHIRAGREVTGRPLAVEDGMIAAIAWTRGAAVATRNIPDFDGLGVDLVDPWAARA